MADGDWKPPRCVVEGVTVAVGVAEVHLLPARWVDNGYDDGRTLPWAWGAVCSLSFQFSGGAVMTKRVRALHRMGEDEPTNDEALTGRIAVEHDLVRLIERHGIDVQEADLRLTTFGKECLDQSPFDAASSGREQAR